MPGGGGGEKTEKATGKKRSDERKKGNVFMSKDIVTVVSLISSFYIIKMFIGSFLEKIQINYMRQLSRATMLDTITNEEVIVMFLDFAEVVVTTVLPAMMIIGAISILATGVQTKFLFTRETIKFKLSRINLLKGMKKFVSLKSLVELVKSLIKITIIISILYNKVLQVIAVMPHIMGLEILQAAGYAGNVIMELLTSVAIAFIGIAALDFMYQRYEYEKGIKMTKQEIKDEYKQQEGDPKIKGKRRQKQQELAQSRMMQSVQEADVVVRNPTHYAVALRYRMDDDPAPIVLAKGMDHVAAKIVEEAEKHGIPTIENPPLARGLYATADIEEIIPMEFFQPVAELLAWIFTERKNNPGVVPKPSKQFIIDNEQLTMKESATRTI